MKFVIMKNQNFAENKMELFLRLVYNDVSPNVTTITLTVPWLKNRTFFYFLKTWRPSFILKGFRQILLDVIVEQITSMLRGSSIE